MRIGTVPNHGVRRRDLHDGKTSTEYRDASDCRNVVGSRKVLSSVLVGGSTPMRPRSPHEGVPPDLLQCSGTGVRGWAVVASVAPDNGSAHGVLPKPRCATDSSFETSQAGTDGSPMAKPPGYRLRLHASASIAGHGENAGIARQLASGSAARVAGGREHGVVTRRARRRGDHELHGASEGRQRP